MKKYFTLMLMAIFSVAALSCDNRNNDVITQDNDTYSVVLDINNVNFSYNAQDGYFISRTFTKPLFNTDVVLMYRKTGSATDGSPVWQSIPRTLYLANGNELDYDFDFTKNDVMIYASGNYDVSTTPQYLNNQTFRVVLVPASPGGKNANVDYSDYNSVIRYFKIDDSKVKSL
ncbi:hypothetical protein Q73A0000_13805 [Kaistella flava (ex Peng et al. 2021)]|uniref:DUF1735 domain-containing protein n=1 Tax=Kaistella flava (ex Peng et al. 2021) TaxID=2038776 RepID=A0A7M2YAQ6_9FLAO|nr:hypothetical protein [Kaistella flava (ex Peng et al. 2021)]QOW11357.1 hypothetical protein Q73A0000_13805 [Kaistella flava (ex Peng et al. 2021)]